LTASWWLPATGQARWEPLQRFFAMRSIPGLELVTERGFRRNVPGGWVELSSRSDDESLLVEHDLTPNADRADLLATVRRVADLDTDLAPIEAHLARDPVLAGRLAGARLGRLPGAFDRFEVAIRAIVGQQISVAGARTLLGRLVAETAPRTPADEELSVDRFPPADVVAEAPLELGMPRRRRDTIRALSLAVASGEVQLDPTIGTAIVTEQLLAIPGVGPWTAGYIAMRGLGDPDGWPVGDLALRRSLGLDATELEQRAEQWRPWRAYAALLLWHTDPTTATAATAASTATTSSEENAATSKERL